MGTYVGLLAVRHRAVYEGKPIVELLGSLDGLFGMEGMGSGMAVRASDVRCRWPGYLTNLAAYNWGRRARGGARVLNAKLDARDEDRAVAEQRDHAPWEGK